MLMTVAVVTGLAIGVMGRLRALRAREMAAAPVRARVPLRRAPASSAAATLACHRSGARTPLLRLQAPPGCCRDAQLLAEQPLSVGTAPGLPLFSCGRVDCACRYERMGDPRGTERRVAEDRRDAIRFENSRRHRPDRRMPNTVWDQAQ